MKGQIDRVERKQQRYAHLHTFGNLDPNSDDVGDVDAYHDDDGDDDAMDADNDDDATTSD